MCLAFVCDRISCKMAKRNEESNSKIICDNLRTPKNKQTLRPYNKQSSSPINEKALHSQHLGHIDQGNSRPNSKSQIPSPCTLRSKSTSPSQSFTKYAGCKWSEPPLPSALPHPPQHWMQTQHMFIQSVAKVKQPEQDFARQLKVLLKVQA